VAEEAMAILAGKKYPTCMWCGYAMPLLRDQMSPGGYIPAWPYCHEGRRIRLIGWRTKGPFNPTHFPECWIAYRQWAGTVGNTRGYAEEWWEETRKHNDSGEPWVKPSKAALREAIDNAGRITPARKEMLLRIYIEYSHS